MVIAVLLGSVRQERMGDRAASWLIRELGGRGHEAVLVDAAALELPILDKMWKEIKDSPAAEHALLRAKLAPLAELYARADGFCIVSAEYNHSVPPGLSNLIDYFLEEYLWRPSAIVCYSAGPFGGVRAAMQLRAMLAEVGMPSIPSLLPIHSIGRTLSKEGTVQSPDFAKGSKRFFDELDWYMNALKAQRAAGQPY
ncbi:MAG: NADPH-dependent FMN reductase [Acidobacteriaceae bacterium]